MVDNHIASFKALMKKEAGKVSKELRAAVVELEKGPQLTLVSGNLSTGLKIGQWVQCDGWGVSHYGTRTAPLIGKVM